MIIMKKNIYYKIILVYVFAVFPFIITAQIQVDKQVNKSYALSNIGELDLENKYGDVTIYGWNKNEVKITVDIHAKGKTKDGAEDLLERISPLFKVTDRLITIKSEIKDKKKSFFNQYFREINPFDFKKNKVKVNYTIYLPKTAELNILNKYGDVIISEWNGELEVDIEHGDLRLLDKIDYSNITISYGKLKARELVWSKITAKNSDLNVSEAQKLRLSSEGSHIRFGIIKTLELYANNDEIDIEQLNTIFGDAKYATIIIEELEDKITLDLNVTDLKVSNFSTTTPFIAITEQSSDIFLNVADISFHFNAKLEQGVLRIPSSVKDLNTSIIDKKKKIRKISATYGDSNKGEISLTGKKGVITLRTN